MKIPFTTIPNLLIPHAREVELNPGEVLCNDIILPWERHYHGMSLWIIGNEFGTIAAVWASHEQDALDEACDRGLTGGLCAAEEPDQEEDPETWEQWDQSVTRLGNAGEPHNLDYCWMSRADLNKCSPELLCKFAEARGAGHDTLADL